MVLPARRSTVLSLPSLLPVRQTTETGRADLGDCETLFSPNELKLIHQSEAAVVLVELGAIVGREEVEHANRFTRSIKAHLAQIDEFILEPNAPVRGQCVLHTATNEPANVVLVLSAG